MVKYLVVIIEKFQVNSTNMSSQQNFLSVYYGGQTGRSVGRQIIWTVDQKISESVWISWLVH